MRRFFLLLLFAPVTAIAGPPSPSQLCESAIYSAEHTLRLPVRLLGAIAEVESGRPDSAGVIHPWPWTINAEGQGQYFASKQQAIDAVRTLQLRGVRSIDVGCMQVNLMHHPNAFASLDEAFDPTANAHYAGRFLNSLYGESGSWLQAAAAYHSQTPAIGAPYQAMVAARWGVRRPAAVTRTAYRDFTSQTAYRAFQPADRVYGAFADPVPVPTRLANR